MYRSGIGAGEGVGTGVPGSVAGTDGIEALFFSSSIRSSFEPCCASANAGKSYR
ncbi:hypothetical protein ASZ90_014998 [hydrocarbon metagenome]|uniref:Uncharacterized protein n=1 Tax=hydrocarbon metagenome TaxID=938273 RepID=A0A0W8F396_9ZZZZ